MKRKIIFIIAVVLLVAGTGFVLFPIISNTIGTHIAETEARQFDLTADSIVQDGEKDHNQAMENGEIDSEGYKIDNNGKRTSSSPVVYKADIDSLYADSAAYNENLRSNQNKLLVTDYAYENASLNLEEYGIYNGIYGYVSAPSIDMELPIYLGANNANMSYGAAHLSYTSLPLGGSGTNTVLAGHTGYIGRIFFDNIRHLEIGDKIYLKNYWSTLTYKVEKKQVLEPTRSQAIFIDGDRDLLTLVTCISDGKGGFNRYCVTACRE